MPSLNYRYGSTVFVDMIVASVMAAYSDLLCACVIHRAGGYCQYACAWFTVQEGTVSTRVCGSPCRRVLSVRVCVCVWFTVQEGTVSTRVCGSPCRRVLSVRVCVVHRSGGYCQ